MTEDIPAGQVAISVIRDGATAWICEVRWPDGRRIIREVGAFHVAGLPVAITSEEKALECLEAWVTQRPQEWQG